MRLHKAGNVRIRRTPWVTASDIGGTGTGSVTASMLHNISNIGYPFRPQLEVEFYVRRIAGSGGVHPSVQIDNFTPVTVSSAVSAPTFLTGILWHNTTVPQRRVIVIDLSVFGTYTAGGVQQFMAKVVGRGSAADTEWEVTGIRSRLAYLE